MIEPVRIHRDAKGTMRWLEPALERIRAMSARFDGNAESLVNDVCKLHAEKSPLLGLFVAIAYAASGYVRWQGKPVREHATVFFQSNLWKEGTMGERTFHCALSRYSISASG